jgi:hypothetical protein
MKTSELNPHFLVVVQKSNFISMRCDEITTIWQAILAICACVCHRILEKVPILLSLQKVVDWTTSNNLTTMIMCNIVEYGVLSE